MRLPFAALLLAPFPALAEPPQVVTDIAPVHSLVSQVMAGIGTPALLIDGSADPHSVALRPSQARTLEQAELVIWVGEGLEPWLARAIDGLAQAETIELLDLPVTQLRDFDGSSAEGEETPAAADPDASAHDGHGHAASGTDPHAWLSPDNARLWLGALAGELAARDPANADAYRANAEAAIVEVTQLDARISALLAPYAGSEVVTFHDAFGYFTQSYRIDVIGSLRAGDASAPSAAALAHLRDLVAEHDVSCVFSEPGASADLIAALDQEPGVGTGVLDATGTTLTPGPELYGDLMWSLATTMENCLSGT